jgi:hypothetical protein
MMKDTKTYKCDGCDKPKVFDFYNEDDTAYVDKEMAGWITIQISARRQGKNSVSLIPETIGHACSEKCVKPAFANMIKKKLPE